MVKPQHKIKNLWKVIFIRVLLPGLGLLVLLSSCAAPPVRIGKSVSVQRERREEIVTYAEGLIGYRDLTKANGNYRNDCSGFVLGVYRSLGYNVQPEDRRGNWRTTELLYRTLRSRGYTYTYEEPRKGDVVFFKGTFRGSENRISHMGMVTDLLKDGTVVIIHYSSKGVGEIRMNLSHPHAYKGRDGQVINDFLRKSGSGTASVPKLSGELFYAFGDLYAYAEN